MRPLLCSEPPTRTPWPSHARRGGVDLPELGINVVGAAAFMLCQEAAPFLLQPRGEIPVIGCKKCGHGAVLAPQGAGILTRLADVAAELRDAK
jgi:hypothetical protein